MINTGKGRSFMSLILSFYGEMFCDIFSFRMPVTTIGIVICLYIFSAPQDLHFPTIASGDGGTFAD